MLINTTIKVKWNPSNKKYYESKGYKFTRWKDEFEIKVEDLSNGSNVKVQVKCNDCGAIKEWEWKNYNDTYIKNNKKYYCKKCAKKYATEKMIKSRLGKSKSFEQWCYDNLLQGKAKEVLNRWDYELNKYSPNEVCCSSSKRKYYFKCPKGLHKSELKNINGFTYGYKKALDCKACNSIAQWGIDNIGENFLEKYWSDKNNKMKIDPWEVSYGSSIKKIWVKSQNDDCDHFVTCYSFKMQLIKENNL